MLPPYNREVQRQVPGPYLEHRKIQTAQRFVRSVTIPMTTSGKILWSPKSPEWKRDTIGYIAHSEEVDEICTLKKIMKKLPDCGSFRLTYDINRENKRGQWRGSVNFTVEIILAICAAAELNIMGLELCDHTKISWKQATASITRQTRPSIPSMGQVQANARCCIDRKSVV